jgi:hypothetical protein
MKSECTDVDGRCNYTTSTTKHQIYLPCNDDNEVDALTLRLSSSVPRIE